MTAGAKCVEWLEEEQLINSAKRAYEAFRRMRPKKNDPEWDQLSQDLKLAFRYIAKSALNGYYEAAP